ncbi:MAG: Tim44/TimA family putative adaptor protein [Stellaceae bacterium]
MGGDYQILEILVFAVIAGILVFRLRSVLGRRTGNERRRDFPFGPPSGSAPPPPRTANPPPGNMPTRPRLAVISEGEAIPHNVAAEGPGFDRAGFVNGAKNAFGLIVEAFAAGDRARLQPLLSPDVFRSFADAIAARERAKETQETKIVAINSADIAEDRAEGGTALVTVKFVSDQVSVTRGADGAVLDGDPDHPVEHTDLWTFSRPARSPDPNWVLVATNAPPHS